MVEAISDRMILPDALPRPSPAVSELGVRLSPGEYEPASFVVIARTRPLEGVLPRITPLRSSGERAWTGQVETRVVRPWYQSATAWNRFHQPKRRTPVLVPELLVHDDGIVRPDPAIGRNFLKLRFPEGTRYVLDTELQAPWGRLAPPVRAFPIRDADTLEPVRVAAGTQRQFWVTVHAPPDQEPGVYRGSLEIDADGEIRGRIPVRVEVLPFRLAPPGLTYSVYYRARLDPDAPTVSSEGKSPDQLRAELVDMIRHGVTNPTIYQPWPKPGDSQAVRAAKIERLREVLRLRQELGMDGGPIYYLGRHAESGPSPASLARLEADVRAVRRLAAGFHVPEVYFYGADEAQGERLRAQAAAWRRVHAAGGKVFAAGYRGHTREAGGATDVLVLHGKPDREEARQQHGHGNRIFSYANPQSGPENPVLFRRNYGIRLWQANFDGAMIYAYQDSMGSIWNDFDHEKWRDHALTYPTAGGPIATLAWEGLREAIDDVRYVRTLEGALEGATPGTERDAAARFLGSLRDREDFDPGATRAALIDHLQRLRAADARGVTP